MVLRSYSICGTPMMKDHSRSIPMVQSRLRLVMVGTIILMRVSTPASVPSLFENQLSRTSLILAAADTICEEHLRSILGMHNLRIMGGGGSRHILMIVVESPPSELRQILKKEAPKDRFNYSMSGDPDGSVPGSPLKRSWVVIPAKWLHSTSLVPFLPEPISLWLKHHNGKTSWTSFRFCAVPYLHDRVAEIGYIVEGTNADPYSDPLVQDEILAGQPTVKRSYPQLHSTPGVD